MVRAGSAKVKTLEGALRRIVSGASTTRVIRNGTPGDAGLFELDYSQVILRRNYRQPVLAAAVASSAPTATIASRFARWARPGANVVASTLNDLAARGAEPLFVLLQARGGSQIQELEDAARECRGAGCALLTAVAGRDPSPGESPILFATAVGVVEKSRLTPPARAELMPGDQLLGIRALGLHLTGQARVLRWAHAEGIDLSAPLDGLDEPLAKALLAPARTFMKPLLQTFRAYRTKKVIHAASHVRERGLRSAVERLLPPRFDARLHIDASLLPPIISALQRAAGWSDRVAYTHFGGGIAFVLLVSRFFADAVARRLERANVPVARLGEIVPGTGKVVLAAQR